MTVNTTESDKNAQEIHLGDGSSTEFTFGFTIYNPADLRVAIVESDDTETVLSLNANGGYKVTTDNDLPSTGFITYPIDVSGTVLTSDQRLSITSNIPFTQSTELSNAGKFPAKVLENALDKLTRLIIQLRGSLSRTLTIPETSGASGALPLPVAGNVLGWLADLSGLTNYDMTVGADLFTQLDSLNAVSKSFTVAQNGDDTFTLDSAPGAKAAIDVYINGVHQNISSYEIAGVTLTTSPRVAGDVVEVRYRLYGALNVNDTLVPAAGSVDSSHLQAGAVSAAALDDAVKTEVATLADLALTSYVSRTIVVSHGLAAGMNIRSVALLFTCTTTDSNTGYAQGDSFIAYPGHVYCQTQQGPATLWRGYSVINPNATSFTIQTPQGGFLCMNKSGSGASNIDPAKWTVQPIVTAHR